MAHHATLKLTAAGRAAVADGANRGTRAVRFTRAQVGSGLKPRNADDDERAALRVPRDAAAASGNTEVPGRIAWRGDFDATGNYAVTEVGLWGRIGAAPEFLAAYWAVESAAQAIAAVVNGQSLVLAGVIEIVNPAAALAIDVAPTIVFQANDVGDIKASAAINIPAGWLECNGAAVSRADYAALFRAIGTAYGVGDNATTFNLPDFRGRTIIGSGDGGRALTNRSRGQTGGAETHALTEAELPAHDHNSGTLAANRAGEHTHGMVTGGVGQLGDPPRLSVVGRGRPENAQQTLSAGAHGHNISGATAEAGGGGAHENMPPYGVARILIKT